MEYLAAYAMFKRETPWLAEWIEYHRIIGVEKFHLFDAEPSRAADDALRPYVDAGIVVVTRGGRYDAQTQADLYTACVGQAVDQYVWAAFIDLDEFLFPTQGDDVVSKLPRYEDAAALALNWQIFGSSGLASRPRSTLDAFVRRAADEFPVNSHVKLITRPPFIDWFTSPHSATARDGRVTMNERRETVNGPFSPFSAGALRINHYCVKSREDFSVKAARWQGQGHRCDQTFWEGHDRNEVFDDSARRFWPRVSEALARRRRDGGSDGP